LPFIKSLNYCNHPLAIRQNRCRLPDACQLGNERQDENDYDGPDYIGYFHYRLSAHGRGVTTEPIYYKPPQQYFKG